MEKIKKIGKPPLPPQLPPKKKIKPITLKLTQRAALDWVSIRNVVSNRTGIRATNVDVAVELIQSFKDRKKLITQLKSIQRKLAEKDENIFGLLRESINRPINIQVGALAQATQISPGPPRLPPKHIVPISQNIKDDLFGELNSVFDGDIPRPSLIKKAVDESEEKENE